MKYILLGLGMAVALGAMAEYKAVNVPIENGILNVDMSISPCKVKNVDVWSTEESTQVKISRVRSVTTFTNVYDVSMQEVTNTVKVIDNYYEDVVTTNYITNAVWKVIAKQNYLTNVLVHATCDKGFICHSLTNDLYLVYGDKIVAEGLSSVSTNGIKTVCTIIYEK